MQEKELFKESLNNMSIEELQALQRVLDIKFTKAKNNIAYNVELIDTLKEQLLAVGNRITALKIRN